MKNIHHIRLQAAFTIASAALLAPVMPAMAASTIPVPANSGTVEGTAALIKAPPKLGAGPFTLGMSADQAVARMKADGMFKGGITNPSFGFTFAQLPNHPLIGGAYGARDVQAGSEQVGVLFTMYPNEPVVSGISRNLSFTPATAPNVGNTLAELRKKYGPESGSNSNGLYWLFDYQGQPLSGGQLAELKKSRCLVNGPGAGGGIDAVNIVDTQRMSGKISNGYVKMNGGLPSACFGTVRVDVQVTISQPSGTQNGFSGKGVYMSKAEDWARASDDVVEKLLVTIRDTPLDYSASTVSRNTVLNGGAAEQQKKRDAAKQRKPSL
jgi:hypothetical protein